MLGVFPVVLPAVPPGGGKNTNSRLLRFFDRSVPLFRWLMLTPMRQYRIFVSRIYPLKPKHS